jgi:hypothetical protein
MEFQYISLGFDCSPAGALKLLNLRTCAHPFDWTETNYKSISECIRTDFKGFHKNLRLNRERHRLIDGYGIQFPHDYPTVSSNIYMSIGDNFYGEQIICEDYEKYADQVVEKYGRRIERFRNAMADSTKPIIVLYRGLYEDSRNLKQLLENTYGRENIVFVVGTREKKINQNPSIIACDPEERGKWNDPERWGQAIEIAKQRYPYLLIKPVTTIKRFSMRF